MIVGAKNPSTAWLSPEEADAHCISGASVWNKFSTEDGLNPDVVLVGCGVEVTYESICASALLRKEGVRVRFVNVTDLMILDDPANGHPHALDGDAFNSLFTADKPVIFSFHGYPKDVASLLFARSTHLSRSRIQILGYIEQGTTTTPYSMLRVNKVSRYDVASIAVGFVASKQPNHPVASRAHLLQGGWKHALVEHEKYTIEHGDDPAWCGEIPSAE